MSKAEKPTTSGPAVLPGTSLSTWLQSHPRFRIIRLDSDAMAPTFNRDDFVLFDAHDITVTCDAFYVMQLADKPTVRRLQVHPGAFAVIADNPRYLHSELPTCDADQLNILGRVVARLQRI